MMLQLPSLLVPTATGLRLFLSQVHKSELLGERAVIIFINLAIKPCSQFVTLMVNNRISLRTGDCVCFDGIDTQVCSVPDIIKVKVPVCFLTLY